MTAAEPATAHARVPVRNRIDAEPLVGFDELATGVPFGDDVLDASAIAPADAFAMLTLAHGAGAGMRHPFMTSLAQALAAHGVATLRFQFPSMQHGRARVDTPPVAYAALRAARVRAHAVAPTLPVFAGGKSFGGRMTTQAEALRPDDALRGIVLVGFPLHPAGRPAVDRAAHLADVRKPMLLLQGDRDALADLTLLRPLLAPLTQATLAIVDDADHGFHVRVASGRRDADVIVALAATTARWMRAVLSGTV